MQIIFVKHRAFTLAEVLITLGIIGVVAAMTIPGLLQNMTGIKYRSQFKKTISTLNQAVRLNKANYGWDFADVNVACAGKDFQTHTSEEYMSICSIINSNLSSKQGFYRNGNLSDILDYDINGDTVGFTKGEGQYTVYMLADGSLIGFRSASFFRGCTVPVATKLSVNDMMSCTGFIDVNGLSLPNEETKCSVGTTSRDLEESCIVNTRDLKDVYPIIFHDAIVEGATNAAKYVLQTSK